MMTETDTRRHVHETHSPVHSPHHQPVRLCGAACLLPAIRGEKSRAAALAGVSSPILTGMPHGSDISDPVTRAVERRERLLADCAMIERAAELAGGGGFYHALILNCCHGIGYLYMDPTILPTANRNAFFRARREFYWLLNQFRSGEI